MDGADLSLDVHEAAPHSLLESLLSESMKDSDAPELPPLGDDSILEDEVYDDAEAARREELRRLWEKPAPLLEEISSVDEHPVLISDSEILARTVLTPSDMPASANELSREYNVNTPDAAVIDPTELTKRYRAQRKICRVWRRYSHIRVFAYFKQLISFKNHGHPVALLRCICPQEAALVADPSSGIFVRFRLAGDRFPPLIVYKLFTSVPVQDIGAFAPRDYTKVRGVPAAELHNYQATDCIPKKFVPAFALVCCTRSYCLSVAAGTTRLGGIRELKTITGGA
jgi:hypothetical protein